MGIVTKEEVCRKLKKQIKKDYQNLLWCGIKMGTVSSIEEVEVNIDDNSFYSGSGDYNFNGFFSFMINAVFDENDKPIGCNSKRYVIFPHCKVNIKEINNDFEIKIIEPIQIIPHH